MYCNVSQCRGQGYCDCRDETAELASGCGELLGMAVTGIISGFLYPAIKISRSRIKYDQYTGSPKFAGIWWLAASPVFGYLSVTLYQLVFNIFAVALGTQGDELTTLIYTAGVYSIFTLAMGLASITFLIKNRAAIRLFVTEAATISFGKSISLLGVLVMIGLTALSTTGIVSTLVELRSVIKPQPTINKTIHPKDSIKSRRRK